MKRIRLFLPLLLLASIALAGGTPALAGPAVPRFDLAPCPFHLAKGFVEGKTVHCGYLTVLEDRSQPDGHTLRLAVAIFKSRSKHPLPDPVVFLGGGPGGPTVILGSIINKTNADDWIGDHDLVLIDQRGTGYSEPALTCAEVAELTQQTVKQKLTQERAMALVKAALQRCRDHLVAGGVNLNAYNSVENAADIADLRTALGYKEVDLYGGSYGTRLALTVMRYHPEGIRSVILDSTYPPQVNFFTDPMRSGDRALHAMFAGCAKAELCNTSYPHLDRVFYTLVKRLNAKPIQIPVQIWPSGKTQKVWLDGATFYSLFFEAMYATPLIHTLPETIYEAHYKDWGPVSKLYSAFAGAQVGASASAMFWSVECSEDAPYTSPQQIEDAVATLPPAIQAAQRAASLGQLDICKMWNVKSVDPVQKEPVVSSIPTLILEGEYDPITSPGYGDLAAKTLSHSFTFEFPGTGHVVRFANSCPNGIVWSFLANPAQKPDASCIAEMTPAFS